MEHLVLLSDGTTRHDVTITGLDPETTYYFAVKSGEDRAAIAETEQTVSDGAGVTEEVSSVASPSIPPSNGLETVQRKSGGGGGYNLVVTPARDPEARLTSLGGRNTGFRLPKPQAIVARAADAEVAFFWTTTAHSPLIHTRIVRQEGRFPLSPTDGKIVFEGLC